MEQQVVLVSASVTGRTDGRAVDVDESDRQFRLAGCAVGSGWENEWSPVHRVPNACMYIARIFGKVLLPVGRHNAR